MKNTNNNNDQGVTGCHTTSDEIKDQIRSNVECIMGFCTEESSDATSQAFEKHLLVLVFQLGCLFFQLFLVYRHEKMDYSKWINTGQYYKRTEPVVRKIKTVFGQVVYWRTYLVKKDGSGDGFHPLDAVLGLTRDGFSPFIISLATRLATRVSFGTCTILFECFYNWSPSTDSIEQLVLGLGREAGAYMEVVEPPEGDGEVLVIEIDGKATPTATASELNKRRGKRKQDKPSCCQRHRGRSNRKNNKKNRRKKGDKSKNGRSITIVVMYTLKRGEEGLLHGPINKIVWASYAPRKVMFDWARTQATKRGFPPGTDKRIHIAVDGEKCLREGMEKLFENATFVLDIRHVEEYLWKVGRAYYNEGSDELEVLVGELIDLVYQGRSGELVSRLKEWKQKLSKRANRDKKKREVLSRVINYLEPRMDMLNYQEYLDEDLPIATGIVEGAARYVVGERMDCAGMRWIPGRAEALLQLRCIELNGDWDKFFDWGFKRRREKLLDEKKVMIRSNEPLEFADAV
jgi:hypothetical protein